MDGYPVSGHVVARGVIADVLDEGGRELGLALVADGFSIDVQVSNVGADGRPLKTDVPVSELVALADALTGIPAS